MKPKKDLNQTVKETKEAIKLKIFDYLQVMVAGHWSARPAVMIPPKGVYIYVKGHQTPQRLYAYLLDYAVVKTRSGKIEWHHFESMFTESLLHILNIIEKEKNVKFDKTGKYLRAINPWWFIGSDCTKVLVDVVEQPLDKYLKTISQNNDGE